MHLTIPDRSDEGKVVNGLGWELSEHIEERCRGEVGLMVIRAGAGRTCGALGEIRVGMWVRGASGGWAYLRRCSPVR